MLKRIFWNLPISLKHKNKIIEKWHEKEESLKTDSGISNEFNVAPEFNNAYIHQILRTPIYKNAAYRSYCPHDKLEHRAKLVAYYLTQYHPTEKNNLWWGKGTTEWTNVTKSVPQFVGHIQPKLPGDLGFYDLRIKENMQEQISIATNYGVDAFCFYYYWFNGERALEIPLNIFLKNKDLDIQFSLCWCNEDWTKRYSGLDQEVLLEVGKSEDSYKRFIEDVIPCFMDERYLRVQGRPILTIYRPSQMPDSKRIISYWNEQVKKAIGEPLYVIASQEADIDIDWTKKGFDAVSQFQPASVFSKIRNINSQINFIRNDFGGNVFDYKALVKDKAYKIKEGRKIFPAVMPAWDNTSRRNQNGNIFIGSTPKLYREWLENAIKQVTENDKLEEKIVFINAWNEWGEGAYLEPDREYGYAYLEETFQANCGE